MSFITATIHESGHPLESMVPVIEKAALATTSKEATIIRDTARRLFPPPSRLLNRYGIKPPPKEAQHKMSIITVGKLNKRGRCSFWIGGQDPVLRYIEFGTGRRGAEDDNPSKSPYPVTYRMDWICGMISQPSLYPAIQGRRSLYPTALKIAIGEALSRLCRGVKRVPR